MPLKVVLDKLDELPETLHALYAHDEKANKYYLDLDKDIEEHPLLNNLRTALESHKAARKKTADEIQKLKERLAKVPDNYDPADAEKLRGEIATLQARIEEYENDPKYKEAGVGDKMREEAVAARRMLEQKMASIEKAHAVELAKLENKLKSKDNFISKLLIEEGLTKALVDAGVAKEYMKAARAMLAPNVKVTEEEGEYSALVETDTGPLDISKFVADWVASDEGKPFIPPAKGADAGGTGKPAKQSMDGKNPWIKGKDTWNLTEQGRILKTDRMRAERLAKAAGQKLPPAM